MKKFLLGFGSAIVFLGGSFFIFQSHRVALERAAKGGYFKAVQDIGGAALNTGVVDIDLPSKDGRPARVRLLLEKAKPSKPQ